jgi:hypothetical protein
LEGSDRFVRDGRTVHVVRGRGGVEEWTFGDQALAADVIAFWGADGPALWIPRDELLALLPDLHPMGDGWQLVVREGRVFTAEWAFRESVERWRGWPAGAGF